MPLHTHVRLRAIDISDFGLENSDPVRARITFKVIANDEKTTLDQDLVLTRNHEGWFAAMEMKGFPPQETPAQAAEKLADWFQRMAIAMRSGRYDAIDLNDC